MGAHVAVHLFQFAVLLGVGGGHVIVVFATELLELDIVNFIPYLLELVSLRHLFLLNLFDEFLLHSSEFNTSLPGTLHVVLSRLRVFVHQLEEHFIL